MLPAKIKEVQSGNPSLYDCFFALIGCIECDQSLAAPASFTSSANCAGNFAWFSPSSGEISFRYRAIFGLGNWAIALSGGWGKQYYQYSQALANHFVFDFSSYLYFNAWFGLSGSSSLGCFALGGLHCRRSCFGSDRFGSLCFPIRTFFLPQAGGKYPKRRGIAQRCVWSSCFSCGSFGLDYRKFFPRKS